MSEYFQRNRYMVRKKVFKLLGGAFHVYDESENVVLYSKQKAFKLREDIRLYTGEDMRTEVLTIHARSVIDFGATYDVVDAQTGESVGALRRKGLRSMLRDRWLILGPDDAERGMMEEDNMALALVRRFMSNLVPQGFSLTYDGREVARMQQRFNPFIYKIDVDFSPAADGSFDKRLGIALAVLVCAIEGRQD
jgi:uncharacterized protein YxjI